MVCSAWLAIDLAESSNFDSEVMPVLAAWSTCTPLAMPSSRLLMSLARLSSDCAVKKLVGLSSAEFTFLPVERRDWVVARRSAVDWSESRFWRTDAERTIPDITLTLLVYASSFDRFGSSDAHSLRGHG
ncbi:hypothetical protein ACVWWO_001792 [Bradyrhizobium sp. F1.13.1]